MKLQFLFLDELGNIRSGWRILLFLLILFAVASIVFYLASVIISDLAFYSPLLLVICVFLATMIMILMFEKRPLHSVGLPVHKRMPIELLQGALVGGGMMSIVFFTQYSLGWVTLEWQGFNAGEISGIILYTGLLFFLAAFGEELFFRGYPFQILVESIKAPAAVIVMSVAFSAAHMMNPNISLLALVNILLAGVWLSVAYLKTRTLWFPAGLHMSWNFLQGTVFSYPVSGQLFDDKTLFTNSVSGPDSLTGGEFGPEAGLMTTIVLILGTLYIYKSKYFIIGEGVWTVERYIRDELERYAK
jgi:uncharacterized protein